MNLQLLNFPENITEEIKESLNNVLTSSFWSTGPQSQNLEQNFSEIYKRECISTSSGGTALQLLHDYFRNVKRIAISKPLPKGLEVLKKTTFEVEVLSKYVCDKFSNINSSPLE